MNHSDNYYRIQYRKYGHWSVIVNAVAFVMKRLDVTSFSTKPKAVQMGQKS